MSAYLTVVFIYIFENLSLVLNYSAHSINVNKIFKISFLTFCSKIFDYNFCFEIQIAFLAKCYLFFYSRPNYALKHI